jgi:hypothetical protein
VNELEFGFLMSDRMKLCRLKIGDPIGSLFKMQCKNAKNAMVII